MRRLLVLSVIGVAMLALPGTSMVFGEANAASMAHLEAYSAHVLLANASVALATAVKAHVPLGRAQVCTAGGNVKKSPKRPCLESWTKAVAASPRARSTTLTTGM